MDRLEFDDDAVLHDQVESVWRAENGWFARVFVRGGSFSARRFR